MKNHELRMKNVLSFRKKVTANELQKELLRINSFIETGGYTKTGPTVTATFSIERQGLEQVMDIEFLLPLDKPFIPPEGCTLKPEFKLVNAVSMSHAGNPAELQNTCNKLMEYIQNNNLQPITAAYNVTTREAKTQAELDNVIVDVYIGISPNVL